MEWQPIKDIAYVMLVFGLSVFLYRALNKRDYATIPLILACSICAYLLRVKIGAP